LQNKNVVKLLAILQMCNWASLHLGSIASETMGPKQQVALQHFFSACTRS
jgi:hypothetical protein